MKSVKKFVKIPQSETLKRSEFVRHFKTAMKMGHKLQVAEIELSEKHWNDLYSATSVDSKGKIHHPSPSMSWNHIFGCPARIGGSVSIIYPKVCPTQPILK